MASYRQETDFIESVVGRDLLDNAITWIAKNLNPDDVFSEAALSVWARDNGFSEEG